jgi:hypothetical protein
MIPNNSNGRDWAKMDHESNPSQGRGEIRVGAGIPSVVLGKRGRERRVVVVGAAGIAWDGSN